MDELPANIEAWLEEDYKKTVEVGILHGLSNADLLLLAGKCPPPQEWFDTKEDFPF